ncbi:hypothetical protein F5148DRAFT_1283655 [Russula earlei]|uniref:Uncharacterized protein n=1 Tax=Russula earlei TaxID=71964 RepID=A0ACC0UAI4_9AGAM|nr:hypothetical protein F5148DRAFT_1283655 [Russula earlei]
MPSSECNALGSCTPTPSAILTTFLNRPLKIVDDALRSAAEVKNKDSSSGILNTLTEKLKPAPDPWSDPTTVVEFLLFKSLPDDNPTVVKQELGKGSKLTEMLWNFVRYKDERRLILSQNPHFYKHLPGIKAEYTDDFRTVLTEDFQMDQDLYSHGQARLDIYLESDQNSRAFRNVWAASKAIIFKALFLPVFYLFTTGTLQCRLTQLHW